MIFCFDIDGVICRTKGTMYTRSKPLKKNIKVINMLYEKGHTIILHTGRYFLQSKIKKKKIIELDKNNTRKQLKRWGLKYNKLFFNKPNYDIFIDDKNFGFKKNWSKKLIKEYL